jgi:ABC-type multidrug transport system fused ATPase/permease subunit
MPHKLNEIKLIKFVEFLGKRGVYALVFSLLTGFGLAVVDLVFASLLEVLLVHMSGLSGTYKTGLAKLGFNLDFNAVLLAVASVAVVRGIVQYLVSICADLGRISISTKLWTMTIRQSLAVSKNYISSSELTRRISDLQPKMEAFVQLSSALMSKVIYICAIFIALMLSAWRESLLFFICLAGLGLILRPLNEKVRAFSGDFKKENDSLIVRIQSIVRNRLLVHVLMTEQKEVTRMTNALMRRSKAEFSTRNFANLGYVIPLTVGPILLCLMIYVQNTFWPSNLMALGAVFYLSIRFAQTFAAGFADVSNLNARWPSVNDCYVSYRKLENEVLPDGVNDSSLEEHFDTVDVHAPVGIKVEGLNFSFATGPNIFHDFKLDVSPGQHVGIVGATGAGKSTLLAIISGLERPTKGVVKIDGYTPLEFRTKSLKKVSYVSSEPFFFEGTLLDNLSYGLKYPVSKDEILKLVDTFGLSAVLQRYGLNYYVDEQGMGFSAGQKQKLALVRAMLNRPQLLLLDEASANLDVATERNIADILKKMCQHCTILNVSHRRGFLIHADKIIDLDQSHHIDLHNTSTEKCS